MVTFFPALAHTDIMGYFDRNEKRQVMSVRRLLPKSMQERILMSLSFEEDIHYSVTVEQGDHESKVTKIAELSDLKEVFVDCGAFHYSKLDTPKFLGGGFVRSSTAIDEYQKRHLSRNSGAKYLLCSPDHIIHTRLSEEQVIARREFTRVSARSFLDQSSLLENCTPVGVVHGRTLEERKEETEFLIDLGYEYIAIGGLVPLARNSKVVLHQLAGISPFDEGEICIDPESPLGIIKRSGAKVHIFGLNSPEWYRWWKRLGITSFDGSKLSTEGAANGIIWIENEFSMDKAPRDAKSLYRALKIKNITKRTMEYSGKIGHLEVSEDGIIERSSLALEYLLSARCTSPNCPHGPEAHSSDPRVLGSIEHNMGRMIVNAWTYESLMRTIDSIIETSTNSGNENLRKNWSPIGVGN